MASRSLGTLTIDLVANIGGFRKGMTQAEREADKSSRRIQQRMKAIGAGIDAALQIAAAAFAASVGAIIIGVDRAIDRLDEIGKSAQKVGVTTESMSRLAYAASLADVEFTQLEGALAKLAKTQDAAAAGSTEQLAIFRALGVEFQNADGTLRKVDEVFADLADAFQKLPDGANKTTASMTLLGRSGAQLIPLMNDGADGIRNAGDELARFGGVVGPEAARQAEEFNDNITRLKAAVDAMWQSLAMDLLPSLVDFTEGAVDGAKAGGDLNVILEASKTLIHGFGMAAQAAVDGVQALTGVSIGLFNVLEGLSRVNPTNWLKSSRVVLAQMRQDFAEAGAAFAMIPGAGAETRNALFGAESAPAGRSPFEGSRPGRAAMLHDDATEAMRAAEAERALAAAIADSRGETERNAAAKAAAAEAARAQAEAERLAKQAMEEAMRATADFRKQTEDLAAELSGPVAQVQLEYTRREKELVELARLAGLSQQDLAASMALLTQARERDLKAAQLQVDLEASRLGPYEQLLQDMAFDLELAGQTNAQRTAAIELERILLDYRERGLKVSDDEQAAMRQAIEDRAELLEASRRQVDAMDEFRSSFEDNVAAVLDGSKSIKDAIKDMVSDFLAQMARAAAQRFTEQLLGQMGTTQGGAAGGGWAALFGAFFGGGKAAGGPVASGVPYLVGEQGKELFVPSTAGTIIPADRTASALRPSLTQNFLMPGRYDLRTQAQVAADAGRVSQRAMGRRTAA